MAAILVSAFPGLGKTYLYQQYKDKLKILDLNTGRFEGDDFPGNYIAEVEKRLNDYDLILNGDLSKYGFKERESAFGPTPNERIWVNMEV